MRRGGGQESSSKKRGGGKTIINWSVVVLFTDFVSLSYRCHLPSNFLMLSDRFFAMYCNQLKWKSLLHWCKHKCYFFGKPKKSNLSSSRAFRRKHHAKNMTAFFVSLISQSKQKNNPFFYLSRKWQFSHVNHENYFHIENIMCILHELLFWWYLLFLLVAVVLTNNSHDNCFPFFQ